MALAKTVGDRDAAMVSHNANVACCDAIVQAIGRHYDYTRGRLDSRAAVGQVLEQFGPERTAYITALTIRKMEHDGRVSRENKAWAMTVPKGEDTDGLGLYNVHPGLLNLFARKLQKQLEQTPKGQDRQQLEARTERNESVAERPSLHDWLAGARQALGKAPAAQPQRARGGTLMAAKTRPVEVKFRVTPAERRLIQRKMDEMGTTNMGAYLRKMAIDGYAIRVEAPEFKELLRLMGIAGNNLNQLTRKVRATGRVYNADLETINRDFSQICAETEKMAKILSRLDRARR